MPEVKNWQYGQPYGSKSRLDYLERHLAIYGETPDQIDRIAKAVNLPYAMAAECRLAARRRGCEQEKRSRI